MVVIIIIIIVIEMIRRTESSLRFLKLWPDDVVEPVPQAHMN